MHVGRKVDKPWLIHILDNTGKVHAVDIQPGEMLFYEVCARYFQQHFA